MGRRSLADQFFEHYREEEPGELVWLVLHSFEKMKTSGKFYDNLTRVMALAKEGTMLQYSRVMTQDQRAAKTVRDLVLHYGGDVSMFRGEIFD